MRTISPGVARRLAVSSQRLAGPASGRGADGMLDLIRQLGCLQLDPTSVVAPSHRLVLWSRLGNYRRATLERLQWETRQLFEYWAHAASIVLTEDYPIHRRWMQAWARGEAPWSRRLDPWVRQNAALKRHIVGELRKRGPLPARAFEDRAEQAWRSSGWTSGRNVDRMLAYLWMSGAVCVAGRDAGRRWWDLSARWLPDWTPKTRSSEREVVRQSAQRSLRALGIARTRDIERHFIEGRYPGLATTVPALVRAGTIVECEVRNGSERWPGTWYVHALDVPLIDRLQRGEWQPRTTLLSPFDNLIRDRARTRLVFGFEYSLEIYVPRDQRKYGYFVMPILHGDRLIGRIDPALDRKSHELRLNAIHLEPCASAADAGDAVAEAIADLATFLGAEHVRPMGAIPTPWRGAFRKRF